MSQEDLVKLREKLLLIYNEYFELLGKRRLLVKEINRVKQLVGVYKNFSPEQEKVLFHELQNSLFNLDLKELFALSLMIENHSQYDGEESYPSWSMKVHLETYEGLIYEQINPLLLRAYDLDFFNKLTLKENLKKMILGA